MAQLLYREQHGQSKADMIHMTQVRGFNPQNLRSADVLKSRRAQLLPLLLLYVNRIPVLHSYKKKAKTLGFMTRLQDIEVGSKAAVGGGAGSIGGCQDRAGKDCMREEAYGRGRVAESKHDPEG